MPAINHVFHIDASLDQVFTQLTTLEGLAAWWTEDCRGTAGPGGEIAFYFNGHALCTMQVQTENAPSELVWHCSEVHPDWVGTDVSFQLSSNEGKTRVAFAHTGWAQQDDFYAQCNFSWGRYMVSLRQLCEQGKGEPWPKQASTASA